MYLKNLLTGMSLLQIMFSSVVFAGDIAVNGNFSIKKGEVAELMATGSCADNSATKNFKWTIKEKIGDGVFSTEAIFYFYPQENWTEKSYHVNAVLYCNGAEERRKEVVVTIGDVGYKTLTVKRPLVPANCKGEIIESGLDINSNNILDSNEITSTNENFTEGKPLTREELVLMIKNKEDITSINTCKIKDMNNLFALKYWFSQDISGWNTGSVTDMHAMFMETIRFNSDIGSWDVSKVTDMSRMFSFSTFNRDIGDWDTSNVVNMHLMFEKAGNFNQDISSWNISKVTDMGGIFKDKTMFTDNYNAILNSWSSQNDIKHNLYFHGGDSLYSKDGEEARNRLINEFGWHIIDGGKLILDFDSNSSCNYRNSTNSCIKVKTDNSKLNLYLKHDDNPVIHIEHVRYTRYHNRIVNVKFLAFNDGSYSIFWTPYNQMTDDSVSMVRFNDSGEEIVPKKRLIGLGHAGFNPDVTLLKNNNFILDWCSRGDTRKLALFNNQGEKLNYFSHSQYSFLNSCRSQHAVITPFDDGGFNFVFDDYNQTFDNSGNPI